MDTPAPAKPPTEADMFADFEAELLAGVESGDDFAAREMLAAGKPIYYVEADTPAGLIVKELPDGRRQLVRHMRGNDEVIRDL